MQNHYNPIWREDERELIPLCRSEGIGLVPYSPMARGYLCGPDRRAGASQTARWRTDDYAHKIYGRPSDDEIARVVSDIAKARGCEPGQVALAWTLSRPGVTAAIFGATSVAHVDAAKAALEIKLEDAEIAEIELQEIIVKDIPMFSLFYSVEYAALRDNVHGFAWIPDQIPRFRGLWKRGR